MAKVVRIAEDLARLCPRSRRNHWHGWLGLSFNCCRCHSHKIDPITNAEYYQLSAYFNSIEESGGNDAGGLANPNHHHEQ